MENENHKSPEGESDKQIRNLIFIDDDIRFFQRTLQKPLSQIKGLRVKFMHPDQLKEIQDKDLLQETILFVDQFAADESFTVATKSFLERARTINPNLNVIETSYAPKTFPSYKGSIYITTVSETIGALEKNLPKFVEKPEYLFTWVRNNFNLGFHRGKNSQSGDDEYLRDIFGLLYSNSYYEKLSAILGMSKFELDDKIRYQDFKNYRLAIHLSWNIIGHLSINSNEEYYGLQLQRLKELITPPQQQEES